ncbi:MAG: hypothetical protein WCF20_01305 [Methylovirgula sp.]
MRELPGKAVRQLFFASVDDRSFNFYSIQIFISKALIWPSKAWVDSAFVPLNWRPGAAAAKIRETVAKLLAALHLEG